MPRPTVEDVLDNNQNTNNNRNGINPDAPKQGQTGSIVSLNQQSQAAPANPNKGGFGVPEVPAADANGLPSNKTASNRIGTTKRNIINWFVPEFGIINMYVNPEKIQYSHKKNINKVNTKNGFLLQYWGEDLSTLVISGTTGSSGVEGINVLYEIYRAEQYAFDNIGVSLAANNASFAAAEQIIQSVGDSVAGGIANGQTGFLSDLGGAAGTGVNAIFGQDLVNNALAPRNIPTLASLAFSVEMYYAGWIYRGYFQDMTFSETTNFLWDYTINFVVTQRRGYRYNNMAFQKSAIDGPSGDSVPMSFYKKK